MEATQGISLYSYLHCKQAKNALFYFLSSMFFSSTKSDNKRAEHVLPRGGGRGRMAQIIYIYVSNYKNDKIKFKIKKE
jgi:hypothetical protein